MESSEAMTSSSAVPGKRRLIKNYSTSQNRARGHQPSSLLIVIRVVLTLIALQVAWTIGCVWLLGDGENLHISVHQSALRARASWLLEHKKSDQPILLSLERGNAKAATGDSSSLQADIPNESNDIAWSFAPAKARAVQSILLKSTGRKSLPLQAFAEPPLAPPRQNATSDAPRLSARTHSPESLTKYEYPLVQSCADIPKHLPTGHPSSADHIFGPNTFNKQPLYTLRDEYAKSYCPVDADPFLPWIHDVFPSWDGRYIEFVAHNKRRCNTDPRVFWDDIMNLEGQVALMQSVPIKRLEGGDDEADRKQPNMWRPKATDNMRRRDSAGDVGMQQTIYRYRLASHEEADDDARETRFICRFHTLTTTTNLNEEDSVPSEQPEKIIIGETLSVTPYNYELLNLRKPGSQPMLTRPESKNTKGGSGAAPHNSAVWNAMHHFRCPVPEQLVGLIESGETVIDDLASIYVDIVPIRTYPRLSREGYIKDVVPADAAQRFHPDLEWGSNHVLPRIEASGRWANFPICHSPSSDVAVATNENNAEQEREVESSSPQLHYLIGCTWASAAYTTRGDGNFDMSTSNRLFEWLTYNFDIAGFDHIYVYDNTAAHTNETSLAAVTDRFPGQVTRIEWPHRICNNNRPAHSNTGERSSQHSAEASCRIRYGPTAEWISNFDSDEYFVPVGKWNSIVEWLRQAVDKEKKTHILSFFQTRAKPNAELMEPYQDAKRCKGSAEVEATDHPTCLAKNKRMTYLETYNCEPTKLPKPNDWAWRAKKQIYRPWYVLNHFVHYALATTRINDHPKDTSPRFKESSPYERRVDELEEAFMLHTKSTLPKHTAAWYDKCKASADNCPVGIPWPIEVSEQDRKRDRSGNLYKYTRNMQKNCYRHERIINEIGPRLQAALKNRVAEGVN